MTDWGGGSSGGFSDWGSPAGGASGPFSDWGGPKLTFHSGSGAASAGASHDSALFPNFISHIASAVTPDFIEKPVVERVGSIGTGLGDALGSIPGSAKRAGQGALIFPFAIGHDIVHGNVVFAQKLAHGDIGGAIKGYSAWTRRDIGDLVFGMAHDASHRLNLNQILTQDIPGAPSWLPGSQGSIPVIDKAGAAEGARLKAQGFPSFGEWARPALHRSFVEDPLGTALWLLPGVTKFGEIRLAKAAARGEAIATTDRILQKPGWESEANPTLTLRNAKTLEGRKIQRALDAWSMEHPNAPFIGSASRVRRISYVNQAFDTGFAKVQALVRTEQRLMGKLTPDELNATLVVGSGSRSRPDPIGDQVRYYEQRQSAMSTAAEKGVKGAAESAANIGMRLEILRSIPKEVIENPRPEFLAWYRHYSKLDEIATEVMIGFENLKAAAADERRVLEQRLYSGAKLTPYHEARKAVRGQQRLSAKALRQTTKAEAKALERHTAATDAVRVAAERLQRAEESLNRAKARGAKPGPARTELFVERKAAQKQLAAKRAQVAKHERAVRETKTVADDARMAHKKAMGLSAQEHWTGGMAPGDIIARDTAAVGLRRQRPVVHNVDVPNPAIERDTLLIDRQTGEMFRGGGTHYELSHNAGVNLADSMPDGTARFVQGERHPGVDEVWNGRKIQIPPHWVIPYGSVGRAEAEALAPKLQAIENLPVSFDIHSEMIPKASIPGRESVIQDATTRKTERGANNIADKLRAAGHENVSVEQTATKEWTVSWQERKTGEPTPITVGPLAQFGPAVRDPHLTLESTEAAGFFTRVKSTAMNPPMAIGSLKKNRAVMFSAGLVSMNPARFGIDFMHQMRYARLMDRFTSEVLPFAKEIDPELPGGHIEAVENGGKGVAFIATRGKRVPRPVKQLSANVGDLRSMFDEHDAAVREWADGYVFEQIPEAFKNLDESAALAAMKEAGIMVIPKEAKRLLWDSEMQSTSKAIRLFWDRGFMHVWRNLVLTLKGGWLVNNAVTAAAFYALNYAGRDGIQSFADAMAAMPDGAARVNRMRRFLRSVAGKGQAREAFIALDNTDAVVLHQATFAMSELVGGTPRAGRHAPTEKAMLNAWTSLNNAARRGYTAQRIALAPIKRISGWVIDANTRIEDTFRDAAMIAETRQYLRSVGETNRSFENVINTIQKKGEVEPQVVRDLVQGVFDSMGNFDNLTPFERGVMRRWLFPFYSWYKNVLIITAKLIRDEPTRALIVNQLSQAALNSPSMSFGFPHPQYATYANTTGDKQQGVATGFSLGGANPFQTPIDIYDAARSLFGNTTSQAQTGQAGPANLLGPVPQAVMTGLTGIDPFTGGTYSGPGQKQGRLASGVGSLIDLPQARLWQQVGDLFPGGNQLFDGGGYRSKLFATETPSAVPGFNQRQFDGILQFLGIPIRHVNIAESIARAPKPGQPFGGLTSGSNPAFTFPKDPNNPFADWGSTP